jgi:putative flippase GtrA
VSLVSFVFSRAQRFSVFIAVGWLGFALQLTALALLTSLAHWPWLPATIVAVELAVVHNFIWHERVTWCGRTAFSCFERFTRFNVATGMTSIAGNVVLMAICIGVLGLPPIVANAIAVGTMSVVNFVVADRWVFATTVNSPPRRTRGTPVVVIVVAVLLLSTTASAAPPQDAVDAWNRYLVETEARFEASASSPRPADHDVRAEGESLGVPSGTISRWRGSVFIPGARLDQLLNRLQYPGTPPPQDDVVSSRVISRGHDSLRVFIRLERHAIVTVTYDTEHEMTFRRRTPTIATARSVATRIDEVGGGDRGFLWRFHSYWRYEQVAGGVRVDLESLTLSRVVDRVAHRAGVDGQNARGVTRISRPDTQRQPHALTAPD